MKAGTAHKMVLNMISTGAMTRLGYVYGDLMVNVWTKNAHNRTPVAVVMLAANVSRPRAVAALKKSKGHVRQAIAIALK
jgi:N-acetylmuramic acid 6-phosphate etherase